MVWPSSVAFSVTEFFSHNALLCNVDVDVKGGLGVKEKPDYPNSIVHHFRFRPRMPSSYFRPCFVRPWSLGS